jgi:peptidoglycan-associated lipoprotein
MRIGRIGALILVLGALGTACGSATVRTRHTMRVPHTEVAQGEMREALLHLERVHFALDSAQLGPLARAALSRAADILREHPEVDLQVDGYADPRGASEYNLGLGQKRAESVARYLAGLGISGGRLRTISYGEERSEPGFDRQSLARSRRVEFRLMRGTAHLVLDGGQLLDDRGVEL